MQSTPPIVLCAEDSLPHQDMIRRFLSDPADGLCESHGAVPFQVVLAGTGEEAERLLFEAHRSLKPYDLLLLDLELPDRPGTQPSVHVGQGLLHLATSELVGACNAVVVQSAFSQLRHVRHAIHAGAIDFVAKPFEEDELFAAIVAAYKRSRERLAHKWYELQRGKRQRWIIAQARNQVADSILRVVVRGLGEVEKQSTAVADALDEQFKLNLQRDCDELICQELIKLGKSTRGVAEACADVRPQRHMHNNTLDEICVEEIISTALSNLRVGFTHKTLRLEQSLVDRHVVRSFRDELEAIVCELLFSAIEVAPAGSTLTISTHQDSDEGLVSVSIVDHGNLLPDGGNDHSANVGFSSEFERVWVLSLVKLAAESIGSRLTTAPGSEGNVVVLQIRDMGDD